MELKINLPAKMIEAVQNAERDNAALGVARDANATAVYVLTGWLVSTYASLRSEYPKATSLAIRQAVETCLKETHGITVHNGKDYVAFYKRARKVAQNQRIVKLAKATFDANWTHKHDLTEVVAAEKFACILVTFQDNGLTSFAKLETYCKPAERKLTKDEQDTVDKLVEISATLCVDFDDEQLMGVRRSFENTVRQIGDTKTKAAKDAAKAAKDTAKKSRANAMGNKRFDNVASA